MKVIIRKISWENPNSRGIPRDCADIMDYFNRAIDSSSYPLIPRYNKITINEIKNIWISGKDKDITYVAYDPELDKVIGSATLFVKKEKKLGELNVTVDPNYFNKKAGAELVRAILEEAKKQGITVKIHTSVDNKAMQKIMEKLGHKPSQKIENFKEYKDKIIASCFDAYEYVINP